MHRRLWLLPALAAVAASCGGDAGDDATSGRTTATTAPPVTASAPPGPEPPATAAPATVPTTRPAPATTAPTPRSPVVATVRSTAGVVLDVTEVARDLDTVWSLAWDPEGRLWYTERPGRLTRLGDEPQRVDGVRSDFEAGLMGLEIDGRGRRFVMYTGASDNRVVRLEPDGSQRVLVRGIASARIHDGGRLELGPDGSLYAGTGDAGRAELAQDPGSLNGKILRIDPESGDTAVFSRGRRNPQGLCFAPDGRLFGTEHGPVGGDEVNIVTEGSDGGWPGTAGNGIRNYSPAIAPSGCQVYSAGLIPQWRGSMLFGTLRGQALYRLALGAGGAVTSEEVLLRERFGRIRDVGVGPDGAVYLATSNRDQSGRARQGDDRILRLAPPGR